LTTSDPFLWVLAGPNGAGKTTYYERKIRPVLKAEFVNADVLARQRWGPAGAERHTAEAAQLADERRLELTAARRSFVAETVFSHPSKLDLLKRAKEQGYVVWLTFIYLESAELAIARVRERTERGGHDVPADRIRGRYERLPEMVRAAVRLVDRAFIVDNSYLDRALRDVVVFERGRITYAVEDPPKWTLRIFPNSALGSE
jgi:predicted ABC-type ATPase